ncbi:MAG: Maf family protein [Clostridiales bacterium]|nr:Maf family protein [Clostridiales bacterium]
MKLILASGSPRRREILANYGYEFTVEVSDKEEKTDPGLSPAQTVLALARGKADDVFSRVGNGDSVVLAADTVVSLGGSILGKPADRDAAREMLERLSGAVHAVYTGVCIVSAQNRSEFYQTTMVKFYDLSPEIIENYLDSGEPFDKAGAYGIQGLGGLLVESINGDWYNVMGLPAARVAAALAQFGVHGKIM